MVDRTEMQLPALRQRAAVGYASQKARVADGVDADVWANAWVSNCEELQQSVVYPFRRLEASQS